MPVSARRVTLRRGGLQVIDAINLPFTSNLRCQISAYSTQAVLLPFHDSREFESRLEATLERQTRKIGSRILHRPEMSFENWSCAFGPKRRLLGAVTSTDIDRHFLLSQPWGTACIVYLDALFELPFPRSCAPFSYRQQSAECLTRLALPAYTRSVGLWDLQGRHRLSLVNVLDDDNTPNGP